VDEHTAERPGLNEADAGATRSGATDSVDRRKTIAPDLGKHGIDIAHLKG
jgi:hypothetical protein